MAVAASHAAAEGNDVLDRVRVCVSDGFAAGEICVGAPYDLILANILADPLRDMAPDLVGHLAPDLAGHLAPDGLAILSELLRRHEEGVAESYRNAGLRLLDQVRLGDWSTLLLAN